MSNSKYSNEAYEAAFDAEIGSLVDKWFIARKEVETKEQFEQELREYIEQIRTNTIMAAIAALPERLHRPAHNESHMRLDCAACMLKKAKSNLKALIGGDDE